MFTESPQSTKIRFVAHLGWVGALNLPHAPLFSAVAKITSKGGSI